MRKLVESSVVPGHIYPLALLCYDIMPPPPQVYMSSLALRVTQIFIIVLLRPCGLVMQVEKKIGEERVISFHGVGLSVGHEMKFSEIAASCESPEKVS